MTVKKYRIILIAVIVCLAVLAGILVSAGEKEEIHGGNFVNSTFRVSVRK